MQIRALVTSAGTGSCGNVIRALRAITPPPFVVGVHYDRFTLSQSSADTNYVCAPYGTSAFVERAADIVERERINVVMPTDDEAVKTFSDHRRRFRLPLFLPRRATIDLCQDKYALTVFLRRREIPAPLTYHVTSLDAVDRIFARFPRRSVLWCRARRGTRSLAGTAVATPEQARSWISQWRDLRHMRVADFTLSEYLPGRHVIVQSVWRNGRLVVVQAVEVLNYFAAANNPSGVFSLSSLAKTVLAPEAVDVAVRAVRAMERRASGTFFSELREDASGTPCITEINAGRFPSGVTALVARGKRNMVEVFAACAVGDRVDSGDAENFAGERYLVRDIDALPGIVAASDVAALGMDGRLRYKRRARPSTVRTSYRRDSGG
jgi:carbamoyl-phosphate synthase large subunit